MDAVLGLLMGFVSSNNGCGALSEADLVSVMMPLLRDTTPEHAVLISTMVKILEAYMDFIPSAGTLFRGLGGLTTMINRLKFEVSLRSSHATPGRWQEIWFVLVTFARCVPNMLCCTSFVSANHDLPHSMRLISPSPTGLEEDSNQLRHPKLRTALYPRILEGGHDGMFYGRLDRRCWTGGWTCHLRVSSTLRPGRCPLIADTGMCM